MARYVIRNVARAFIATYFILTAEYITLLQEFAGEVSDVPSNCYYIARFPSPDIYQ